MVTPALSDEILHEAVKAVAHHGTITAAARAMGIPRRTLSDRVKIAARRGLSGFDPVMPGFEIKSVASRTPDGTWVRQTQEHGEAFTTLEGHRIKGVSALIDAEGRTIQQWVKTTASPSAADIVQSIKDAFDDYEGRARPVRGPAITDADKLTLIPLADWHIGLYAWGREAEQNWDLATAEAVIGGAIEDAIARSPASAEAIILGGGDLLHSDTNENRTARSGNALQVDGRYQKVLMAACRLVVRTIEAALMRHRLVTVRILPGNHDEHSSVAVAYFLAAWFRDEPRVTVDTDPSLFFWHRFGRVLLGATHGHTVKIADMPSIMAHRRAEDWGATRFRYVHGFHLHHSAKFATEGGGVVSEIHQTPAPQDAWHFGAGFISGRSVQTITYHRDHGEIGRCRVAVIDDATEAA